MPKLTRQEIFTKVLTALRAQGVASYDASGDGCQYRGPNGTKCAVGHLIPDDFPIGTWEGKRASALGNEVFEAMNVGHNEDLEFLEALQYTHDDHMPKPGVTFGEPDLLRWEREMQNIAERYNLTYPEDAEVAA